MKKQHWAIKQQKDVKKIFAPKVHYDKQSDILYITWLPKYKYKDSLESSDGFVFDISEDEDVKGIEIFDFKKRFMKK